MASLSFWGSPTKQGNSAYSSYTIYLIASQLIHFPVIIHLQKCKLQQLIAKTTQVLQEPRGGLENKNGVSILSFKIYLFFVEKSCL